MPPPFFLWCVMKWVLTVRRNEWLRTYWPLALPVVMTLTFGVVVVWQKQQPKALRQQIVKMQTEADDLIERIISLENKLEVAERERLGMSHQLKAVQRKKVLVTQQDLMNSMPWLSWKPSIDKKKMMAEQEGASILIQNDGTVITVIGSLAEASQKGSENYRRMQAFLKMLIAVQVAVAPNWNKHEFVHFLEYVSKSGRADYTIRKSVDGISVDVITVESSNPPLRFFWFSKEH